MIKKLQKRWKEAMARQDWRCTMFPNGFWRKVCCIPHDYKCAEAYFLKSKRLRAEADRELRNCANKILPLLGEIMYIGVRAFNWSKKIRGRPEY